MPVTTKSPRKSAPSSASKQATKLAKTASPLPGIAQSKKFDLLMAFGLFILVAVLYAPVRHYPFIDYDDTGYIVQNMHLRTGVSWTTLKWALTSTEQANWHPLTWMSHALDYQLYGLNAGGHHVSNLLLHAINTVLLFFLLTQATGSRLRSSVAAALFALHPLNVESVVWVAERKNLLCTLFFFLTLFAYGWYAKRPALGRYLLVAALFILGLASKPMVITLPFVLLIVDYWPLQRFVAQHKRGRSFGKLVLEKVPLFALSAASAMITMVSQKAGGAMPTGSEFAFHLRIENAIRAYAIYLRETIWPARLAVFYPRNPLIWWQVGLAAMVVLALTFFAWQQRRERPYLLAGWLWYLGTLFPVIGIVQVGAQAWADRYAYIPLIGIFVAVVWGVSDLLDRKKVPLNVRVIAATAVLLIYAGATHKQITYWRSDYDLWSHAVQVTQGNLLAEDNLAIQLLHMGRSEEALVHFKSASSINPDDPLSRLNIGADYQDHGHLAEAMAEYTAVLQSTDDPKLLVPAYRNLGAAYRKLSDFSKSIESYEQALRIDPQQTDILLAIGYLRRDQAAAAARDHASASGAR